MPAARSSGGTDETSDQARGEATGAEGECLLEEGGPGRTDDERGFGLRGATQSDDARSRSGWYGPGVERRPALLPHSVLDSLRTGHGATPSANGRP